MQQTTVDLNMPFITALLLTGSSSRAEAAVVAGLDSVDIDEASDDELLQAVATAAVRQRSDAAHVVSSWILPDELRNVFHLPRDLRSSFVLLNLVRLPRQLCANLLNLGVQQVVENACAAAQALVMSDMLHYEEVSR